MMDLSEPRSMFVKIRCAKCKNEQIIFGSASSTVNCLVCNDKLAAPTGGRAKILTRVLEILE
ncbi:30S ribosomal protein S27e [Candidatus Woesearchaeota archaeon]|nr:30S ribosomal protein S27e [Candidatus Woesearchaeota archaeon]